VSLNLAHLVYALLSVARVPLRHLGFIVIVLLISHKLHMKITRKPS